MTIMTNEIDLAIEDADSDAIENITNDADFPKTPILRVICIHAAFSVSLLLYFLLSRAIYEDDEYFFIAMSSTAIPLVLLCLSAIISVEIGTLSDTRLQGAVIAGFANAFGVFLTGIALTMVGSNSVGFVVLMVVCCFISGFIGSLAGSVGTEITYWEERVDYHDNFPIIEERLPTVKEVPITELPPGGHYVDGAMDEVVYLAPNGTTWTQLKSGFFIQRT